jgi:hypothetical protein
MPTDQRPRSIAWAWEWALSHLSSKLKQLIDKRCIPMPNGPLVEESIWFQASRLLQSSEYSSARKPLSDIENKIRQHDEFVEWATRRFAGSPQVGRVDVAMPQEVNIEVLRRYVAHLRNDGKENLVHPLPQSDISEWTSYRWQAFSPEHLLVRMKKMYELSILAYEQVIDFWFGKFRDRLNLASTLPARLYVLIEHPDASEPPFDCPVMHRWFEPLPYDQPTEVIVSPFNSKSAREIIDEECDAIVRLRPQSSDYLQLTYTQSIMGSLFGWNDITQTVYEWLEHDFKQIGWLG